jgi:hypothetical protein
MTPIIFIVNATQLPAGHKLPEMADNAIITGVFQEEADNRHHTFHRPAQR